MGQGLKHNLFLSLCASIIITAITSYLLVWQEKNIFNIRYNQNLSFVKQVLLNVQQDFLYIDYLLKNLPLFKEKKLDTFNTNFDYFKILSIEDKYNTNIVTIKTIDITSSNNNTLILGNSPYCVIDISKLKKKLVYLIPKEVQFYLKYNDILLTNMASSHLANLDKDMVLFIDKNFKHSFFRQTYLTIGKLAIIIFVVSNIFIQLLVTIFKKYFAKRYLKLEEEIYNLKQKLIDLQEKQYDGLIKENTRKSFINIDRSNLFNFEQKNSFKVDINEVFTTCKSYFKYDLQKNDVRLIVSNNIDNIALYFPTEWLQFIIINLVDSLLNLLPKASNINININYIKPNFIVQIIHSGISFLWEELEEFNSFAKHDEGIYPLKEIINILKQNKFEVCYLNNKTENVLELRCCNVIYKKIINHKDNVFDLSEFKKQHPKPMN